MNKFGLMISSVDLPGMLVANALEG